VKTLSLSEAKIKLSALLDEIRDRDEEVTITRNGRPVAVLVSADEFDSWKETLSIRADAPLCDEIARGLAELKGGKAKLYTLDELID
jgi:prevent-host-death family protein